MPPNQAAIHAAVCDPHLDIEPSDDLLKGLVKLEHFATVEFVDWDMDPFEHPSWRLKFQSLEFVWPSILSYLEGKPEHLEAAESMVRDWVESDPASKSWSAHGVAKRTHLLAALYSICPSGWLGDSLEQHTEWLKANYAGHHNHGISQDIALLMVGCLSEPDLADFADSRLIESSARKVDDDGLVDEQAPAYQEYVLGLYRWYADISEAGGRRPVTPDLEAMEEVLDHFRMPDGNLVPIGDTYWAERRGAAPTADGLRIYDGYVLGREGDLYFALRFGPSRALHGHNDHTSLFYYDGAPRLVEGGHVGYESSLFRDYLRGPWSHNQVVVEGAEHRNAPTDLERDGDRFAMTDLPYKGVSRERVVDLSEGIMVWDRLESRAVQTFHQLWHLPPGATAEIQGSRATVTYPDGASLTVTQLAPVRSMKIVQGSLDPILGWMAFRQERVPAPVIVSTIVDRDAAFDTEMSMTRP